MSEVRGLGASRRVPRIPHAPCCSGYRERRDLVGLDCGGLSLVERDQLPADYCLLSLLSGTSPVLNRLSGGRCGGRVLACLSMCGATLFAASALADVQSARLAVWGSHRLGNHHDSARLRGSAYGLGGYAILAAPSTGTPFRSLSTGVSVQSGPWWLVAEQIMKKPAR